jgi:large subunit ribosomal protein L25
MATIEVTALSRATQGTGASRRLRRTGRVPGIIYGGDKPAQVVEFNHNTLFHQLKLEAFHASILSLDLGGSKERVLLRDVQMHPWKNEILHLDFQRVSANRKIHMKVPLHFVNAEVSPGVKGGGIINHVLSELDISCLPDDLPEFIEVDLSQLQLGHSIHLNDMQMPKGVDSVQRMRGDNAVVATVQVPRAIVEEVTVAAAAATSEEAAAAAAAGDKKEPEKKDAAKKEGDKK